MKIYMKVPYAKSIHVSFKNVRKLLTVLHRNKWYYMHFEENQQRILFIKFYLAHSDKKYIYTFSEFPHVYKQYTHININICAYDSQPITHSFIFVLSNMVHFLTLLD